MPPHRRRAVERLLPITLEMLGIFCAKPKEYNDSNGLNGGGGGALIQPSLCHKSLIIM